MEAKDLVESAREFASQDPDEETRKSLESFIEAGDVAAIRSSMTPTLAFGTAGLRGDVGPGPARMNVAMVAKVSWALGDYLRSLGGAEAVVVGYDARPDSERFATLCAEVLGGFGLTSVLSVAPVPTPAVSYLVRRRGAAAGVVVTASHNPRGQSGFKVFDAEGVQIVGPWDDEIAARMARAPVAVSIAREKKFIVPMSDETLDAYFADARRTAEEIVPLEEVLAGDLVVPYSPLHGVGLAAVRRALGSSPHVLLEPVPEQAEPDGEFSTLHFPNPEEPGVLDRLVQHAKGLGAEVACANDPDADRFALCLPLGGKKLVRLSGDALGLLFIEACLKGTKLPNPEVISTIVSSPGAGLLAERYGGRMTRTLTGFKWLCHAALESEAFLFAYEEALGYCFAPPEGAEGAMDKDGIVALLVAVRLLHEWGGGAALAEHLIGIYKDIGLWGSFQNSRRFDGPSGQDRMVTQMDRLRETPDRSLGGLTVTRLVDYREQAEHRPWYLGAQDLVRFDLEADGQVPGDVTHGRVLVRPSGTEPKLKAYVHLCSDLNDESEYGEKSAAQDRLARAIAQQVLRRPESITPPKMRDDQSG